MSNEEEEIINEEPVSVEDQLSSENTKPTKLNKNGKPRKVLSPEALEKLKLAREKANAIRKESYTKKLEEKVEKLKQKPDVKETTIEEEVKEEIKEVKKSKSKKKTKIIVEQSSEDSDEFEPNDNVVFVKRVSRKKKEVPVVPEPQLQMELPPPDEPPPPPITRQQLTPQQLLLQKQYSSMFSGGFINKRSYY